MRPATWALAWELRHHPRWRWRLHMAEIYLDGSMRRHDGVLSRADEPLPFLLDDATAGRLLGLWIEASGRQELRLTADQDWREEVARALLHAVLVATVAR